VNFLLDINVLSEVRRPQPSPAVMAWLDNADEDRTFISVISLAELRRGISLMDDGRRRDALAEWLANDLPERFSGRILEVDRETAMRWGDLMAESRRRGVALATIDALLAAGALANKLTLVTRNTKDFEPFGIALMNPWDLP
jgi:predicted nucleic acid-binding protein